MTLSAGLFSGVGIKIEIQGGIMVYSHMKPCFLSFCGGDIMKRKVIFPLIGSVAVCAVGTITGLVMMIISGEKLK